MGASRVGAVTHNLVGLDAISKAQPRTWVAPIGMVLAGAKSKPQFFYFRGPTWFSRGLFFQTQKAALQLAPPGEIHTQAALQNNSSNDT
jgi:hypothetical protein